MDILLAICKGYCDRCHQDEWLYLNDTQEYGLLCDQCLKELDAEAKVEVK